MTIETSPLFLSFAFFLLAPDLISRNSAFTYKGKAVKAQEVSRELGVRYVVEGSVRRAANQVRITVQLIDGMTGGHIWSERYDRELKGLFALQDEVRRRIVLALKVKLTPEEQKRFQPIEGAAVVTNSS